MRTQRAALLAVGLSGVLALSACGGGSGSTPGAPTGDSAMITVAGPFQTSALNYPQIQGGVEAAVKAINASGGLKGVQLEVEACNDKMDPNVATSCVQSAVGSGSVALVGSYSQFSTNFYPLLEAAGMASLAQPTTAADLQSPNAFPLQTSTAPLFAAAAVGGAQQGCQKISAITVPFESTIKSTEAALRGVKATTSVQVGQPVVLPEQVPDYAPFVAQVLDQGADCALALVPAGDSPNLLAAVSSAGRPLTLLTSGSVVAPAMKSLPPEQLQNVLIVDAFTPLVANSDDPFIRQFVEEVKAQDPDMTLDSFTFGAWSAVQLFKAAVEAGADPTDRASVLSTLQKMSAVNLGPYKDLDFTGPRPFNTKAYLSRIGPDGVQTLVAPEPVDGRAAYAAATG